jgi:hypothetical protein
MLRFLVQLGVLMVSAGVFAAEHWAFQPLRPATSGSIDDFVRRKLAEQGLKVSPRADERTLIRRASFDLTGLPPVGEQEGTFSQVVDRLLASPQYGEQWARHWLDVARYSDMKGYVYAREEKR